MPTRLLLLSGLLMTPLLAVADMTLSIRPVGDDLQFRLQGSINTSVFAAGPGEIGGRPGSSFTHGAYTVSGTGGLSGSGVRSTISSSSRQVDLYYFSGDDGLSPFGSIPLRVGSQSFTLSPPFWFGYSDGTQFSGPPNSIRDSIYLPDEYVSGSFIDLLFRQPNRDLSRYYLEQGDYWGVRFSNGAGGQQAITFQVIPEPGASTLLTLAALVPLSRRR
jgi:hypothetical protein